MRYEKRYEGRRIEREFDELKSVGFTQPKGETLGDIIDKYIRESYPIKPRGPYQSLRPRV